MTVQPLKTAPVKPDPIWQKQLQLAKELDAQGIYPPAWTQAQRAPWCDQDGYRQTGAHDADRHFLAASQLYDRVHPALTPSRAQADESLKAYIGEPRKPLAETIPIHEVPLQHPIGQPYVPTSKADAEEKAKLLARQNVNHRTWHDGDALPADLDQWIKTNGYKTSDIYQGPDGYHYRHNDVTRSEAPDVIELRLKHDGEQRPQDITDGPDPAEPHVVRHIADDWLKEARTEQHGLNAKTTQTSKHANDNQPKSPPEILFFEGVSWGGSSLGHVAVNIDGNTYSWGPNGMTIESTEHYLKRNAFRSAIGLPLKLTDQEAYTLKGFIKDYGNTHDYDKLGPNCTDPLEEGLESLGYTLGRNLLPEQLKSTLFFNKVADPNRYNYYPADSTEKSVWSKIKAPWTLMDGL